MVDVPGMGGGGGQTIGVARGEFRINVAQANAATQQIIQNARQITNIFTTAGAAGSQAGRQIAGSFQSANQQVLSLIASLGAAGVVRAGVQAAQSIKGMEFAVRNFSKSQKEAAETFANLRQLSRDFGTPYLTLLEGATSFLPIARQTGASLEKLLILAQQIKTYSPMTDIGKIAFGLKELASGDLTSLRDTADLSSTIRDELRELAKAGKVNEAFDRLSEIFSERGISPEKMKEFGQSGMYAFGQLQSAITEAMATAFTPFLQNVLLPIVTGLRDFVEQLNTTNPALLQTGGAILVVVAALPPLIFGLNQVVGAFKTIRSLSGTAFGALTKPIALAVGTGAMVTGGLEISKRLAAAGVEGGDLGRIRKGEDAGAILSERLSQGVVAILNGFISASKILAQVMTGGADIIKQAIELIGAALNVGVQVFRGAFGDLQIAISNLLAGVANLLSRLGMTAEAESLGGYSNSLLEQGLATRTDANFQRTMAQDRLGRGLDWSEVQAAVDATGAAYDTAKDKVLAAVTAFLFPAEQAGDAVEELAEEETKAATAAEKMATAFGANEEKIRKAAEEVGKLTSEYERQNKEMQEERDIAAARDTFDFGLSRTRSMRDEQRQQARSDADFYRSRAARIAAFNADLQSLDASANQQRLEMLASFHDQEVRRLEDHQRRLQEIQEDTQRAVEEAASSLNAIAVFNALQRGTDAVNSENEGFNRETQDRQEALDQQMADLREGLRQQRDARIASFNQQLADEITARELQRAREAEDRSIRLADEDQDRAIRLSRQKEDQDRADKLRRDAHQRQINDIVAALAAETGLKYQMLQTIVTALQSASVAAGSFVDYVKRKFEELPPSTLGPTPGTGAGGVGFGTGSRPGFGFAAGGTPALRRWVGVNERGPEAALFGSGEMAYFTRPATIFNAAETRNIIGGRGASLTIGQFSPVFGDLGGRSDSQVVGLVRQAFYDVLDEMEKRS